jgi:TM2 domain-containing membrane protein YozV
MKNIRLTLNILFLFLIPFFSVAQNSFSNDIKFVQYLADKEMYKEAVYVLGKVDTSEISLNEKDTLHYQLGWMLYNLKLLKPSANSLLKVSHQSNYYLKSRNFAAYNLAYLGNTDSAKIIYDSIRSKDNVLLELRNFELAGIALLERDTNEFSRLRQNFTYSSYTFANEEKKIEQYYKEMSQFKHKSPFLAGLYSAVIPGAGKFYAGKKLQAIGAFLPIVSTAILTYEAYRKGGVSSARFITYGSVFAIFYVSNIWGSVLAVKVRNNDFNKNYDNKVLFSMHIPLRNFFD